MIAASPRSLHKASPHTGAQIPRRLSHIPDLRHTLPLGVRCWGPDPRARQPRYTPPSSPNTLLLQVHAIAEADWNPAMTADANHHEPQLERTDSLDVDKVAASLAGLPSPTIEVASHDEPNADPHIDRRM